MNCSVSPKFGKHSSLSVVFLLSTVATGRMGKLLAQTGDNSSGMAGALVSVRDSSISIKNGEEIQTFKIDKVTKAWRGHDVDVGQLHVGDDVGVLYRVSSGNGEAIATSIEANIDRWGGPITRISGNRVQIDRTNGYGKATIIFDRDTIFNQGARKELEVGRFLEVIGLRLARNQMQASTVLSIGPSSSRHLSQ